MSALIKNIQIKNFKSVRDLSLECDRINIFIGKPNAGKSNILEAISLLGAGYSNGKFMHEFIRYAKIPQLFSNFNFRVPIEIEADNMLAILQLNDQNNFKFEIDKYDLPQKPTYGPRALPFEIVNIFSDGSHNGYRYNEEKPDIVKKYDFRLINEYEERGLILHPPYGGNFYLIARSNSKLKIEVQKFLKPNGLEFLFDEENQRMAVVQKTEDSLLSFPLHLVPDTFQRYIFHLAAIFSNRNSVLLFEEPESHSYPPYIYQLAQHILNDEGGNQFFLTTHNPYFLLPMMQEGKDVAVFATWFEDYQTHARRLSEDEIREMLDYGVDVFLNLDNFIPA